jgi:hypothetical protein
VSIDTLAGYLIIAASTTLGSFIIASGVDVVAGALLAIKKHMFDPHKLPSFLAEQFATRELLGVLGLGATAGMTAFASTLVNGGLTEAALQTVANVALGAMTAGAAALMASVLKDAYGKVAELFGGPLAPPALAPTPIPVQIVPAPPPEITEPAP